MINIRELIEKEFSHIAKYRLSFLISCVIIFVVIWVLFDRVVYKAILDSKDAEIQFLERQLDIYKGKKYVIGETTYSKLTNTELKEMAIQKRDILMKVYQEYKSFDTLTHCARELSWDEMADVMDRQMNFGCQMIVDYEIHHKVEVVLLREQILLRLPSEYAEKSDIFGYDHPTNPIGFKKMLDDFGKLIYSLSED